MFGEEQCTNSSRGEADHARNKDFNREFEKSERRSPPEKFSPCAPLFPSLLFSFIAAPLYHPFRNPPLKFQSDSCHDLHTRVNETALRDYEDYEREVRNAEFQKEIETDEKTRHVLPRDWRTNKRWASNLRACCMCGMLKTQVRITSAIAKPLC